jgi:thiosulfate dehydrogenase
MNRWFWIVFFVAVPGFAAEPAPLPAGPLGDAIRLGKNLIVDTQHYARDYVGNGLNCSSCHPDAGTRPGALPLTGLTGQFPFYSPRIGKVITLEDRINGCFERSMNGRALPPESREMTAMVAYIAWLSKGAPVGVDPPGRGLPRLDYKNLRPDPANGRLVYDAKCAACHGSQGAGIYDAEGNPAFPALWGDKSFNIGAGMARLSNAVPFVKANMPQAEPGSLSVQDALDVSAYFTMQPRPDFAGKHRDWPNGGKPADARY